MAVPMYLRFRSARPSDRLGDLRRFYVDGLGCVLVSAWVDHDGFDGLIIGDVGNAWQAEFIHDRSRPAPPVPSDEHLLVFYVANRTALASRVAMMEAAGYVATAAHNPYWNRWGVTFRDPDGYPVVLALPHGA